MAKLTTLAILVAAASSQLSLSAQAAPGQPQLDYLPANTNAYQTHTVKWNMWWGENGRLWQLHNNDSQVCQGELVADDNNKQTGQCDIRLTEGSNSLQVSLCNDDGCSTSESRQVNATTPELPTWQADTPYQAGDYVQVGKKVYQAKWWNKNQAPASKAWQFIAEQGAVLSAAVTPWQGGATAAYTIQHDDLCAYITDGIIEHALPALNERDLTASVGIIAGNCAPYHWQAAQDFVDTGHEIFNHSWTHGSPVEETWDDKVEISDAQAEIEQQVKGEIAFYAFPYDQAQAASIDAVKQNTSLIGMRSVNYYLARGVNDADSFDPYFIKNDLFTNSGIWSVYEGSEDILKAYVDDAVAKGGWALRTFHGVEDTSWEMVPLARYEGHLDYVKSLVDAGQLWVAGAADITRYGMSRRYCSIHTEGTFEGGLSIEFDTSDALCQQYLAADTRLTVEVNSDQGVSVVTAHYAQQPEQGITVKQLADNKFQLDILVSKGKVLLTSQ
ncbi:polysaccharide deacetylase family protein [Motilimonas pumila]|nr:polysaccharide deacetylase family protein [Motilimonas pumila]